MAGLVMGNLEYQDFFDNSQPWLAVCDAVFVVAEKWAESKGTKQEIGTAYALGIPVFWHLDDLRLFADKFSKTQQAAASLAREAT